MLRTLLATLGNCSKNHLVGGPFTYDVRTEGGSEAGDSTDRLCERASDQGGGGPKIPNFSTRHL